jgi:hypothetical protein
MACIMKIVDSDVPFDGLYLKAFDFEAENGRGWAEFTAKRKEAKVFPTIQDAFAFRTTVPKCKPLREDGLPNRPLTACTIEFEQTDRGTVRVRGGE